MRILTDSDTRSLTYALIIATFLVLFFKAVIIDEHPTLEKVQSTLKK